MGNVRYKERVRRYEVWSEGFGSKVGVMEQGARVQELGLENQE